VAVAGEKVGWRLAKHPVEIRVTKMTSKGNIFFNKE
jgi:hypothetical protein